MQTINNTEDLKALIQAKSIHFSLSELFHDLSLIRQNNPLIHNVTNLVVMPITANILLSLGASPLMAHAKEELAEISHLAAALVINIGTLDKNWVEAIQIAQQTALKRRIPIVLDPVGAGASRYRSETALNILTQGVDVIRGNASEIMALVDTRITTKGVDSQQLSENALLSASHLAKKYQCIVAISGKTDFIVNATQICRLDYGTPLLTKVVGMGCSLTAIIASFLTVNANYFTATVNATALLGLIGECAEKDAKGPGSFYTKLLDVLHSIEKSDLASLLCKSIQ